MKRKNITLYSSTVAVLMVAFLSWLASYQQSPATADVQELIDIQTQVNELVAEENSKAQPTEVDTIMGWLYPGEPACSALSDAVSYDLGVIKPEYFVVIEGGQFELMTEEKYGCNGYSAASVRQVKSVSEQQFVVVSASYAKDMDLFLQVDERSGQYTKQLVDFVLETGFTGVELDFEDYGGWTPEIYTRYKAFLTRLGNALHEQNKKLMIDVPAVRSEIEEAWYALRLSELEALPVDYIVVMGYDYQYDYGIGEPVAPLSWLAEIIQFTKKRIQDDKMIVVGIPAYGYVANRDTGKIKIVTQNQAKEYSIYSGAKRDMESKELIATGGKMTLVFQDSVSINAKIDVVAKNGIGKVSVWHLGGNSDFQRLD